MERRSLGTGSLKVSKLALGAMTFGSGFTRNTRVDEELASRLVNRALDRDVFWARSSSMISCSASADSAPVSGTPLKKMRGATLTPAFRPISIDSPIAASDRFDSRHWANLSRSSPSSAAHFSKLFADSSVCRSKRTSPQQLQRRSPMTPTMSTIPIARRGAGPRA